MSVDGYVLFSPVISDSVSISATNIEDVNTVSGIFGSHTSVIHTRQPFYIEPKLPNQVTSGDRLLIPIVIVNAEDVVRMQVKVHAISGNIPNGLDAENADGIYC